MVGGGDFKLRIRDREAGGGSPCGCDHFGDWIDAEDFAFGGDDGSEAQGRLSWAGGYIENYVIAGNPRILDESLGNRLKHLADDLVVLFPEGSGIAPAGQNFLVGLHREKLPQSRRRRGRSQDWLRYCALSS